MTTKDWITKAKRVHGDKFDYSLVDYKNAHTPVTIVCKVHGSFTALPCNHVNTHKASMGSKPTGCWRCQRVESGLLRSTGVNRFTEMAKQVHGNSTYDYSQVKYTNTHTPVAIVCCIHGVFLQRPSKHLRGHGCTKCINSHHSEVALTWLMHLSSVTGQIIQHKAAGGEYKVPGTQYKVDGYCKETNTIYEFYGDYWHGNPLTQPPDKKGRGGLTMKELYEKTMRREAELVSLGYDVVSMWESDWINSSSRPSS